MHYEPVFIGSSEIFESLNRYISSLAPSKLGVLCYSLDNTSEQVLHAHQQLMQH
jgi:hypothetical protein